MKINNGLTDEARLEVGQILNLLLADEYVLGATTRDYHWNVTGPDFPGLHEQFDRQYAQVSDWIDEVAERARAVGDAARGAFLRLSVLRCDDVMMTSRWPRGSPAWATPPAVSRP